MAVDRSGCVGFPPDMSSSSFSALMLSFPPSREISGHGSVNIYNSLMRLSVFPGAWWSIHCGSEPFLGAVVHNPSSFKLGVWMLEDFFSISHFSGILSSQLLPEIMSHVEIFVLAPVLLITVKSPWVNLSSSLDFVLLHQTSAGFLLICSSVHFQSHVHNFFLFL